ncbi:MAG: hypothetical protein NT062_38295 [Proteobacteria bacterium]|nr:hypothetical protein [Pseudomonadota bacterium]
MRRVISILALTMACSAAQSDPTPRKIGAPARAPFTLTPAIPPPSKTDTSVIVPASPAPITSPITSVRVLAAIDDGTASAAPVYARADQRVTLYALVVVGTQRYSDAPKLADALPLARAPAHTIAWNKIEPGAQSYSNNTDTGDFRFVAIDYHATPIEHADGGALLADVHPTLTPDHGHGLGTMRYQVVVSQGDRSIASPGVDAHRGAGSSGLTDAVMRVAVRRDDTYLGYLTEMFGQPYIWASAGRSDATHQSDRLEGSDCADLMVYGARRAGRHIAYTWTGGLPEVTRLLGSGMRDPSTGVYVDAKGKPVKFPAVGDLVVFPRHVGALVMDRGTIGVLDDQDIVIHTLFDSPKEEPIAQTGYADKAIEVRRFR